MKSDFIGSNLLVVDGLNLCFRWKHERYSVAESELNGVSYEDSLEVLREELAHHYFMEDLHDTIQSLANSYKAVKIVLLADFGGSKWRLAQYPEYKANREEKKALQRPCDNAAFRIFFEAYSEAIKEIEAADNGITVIYKEGIEADDIAAFIATNCVDNYEHIWLVSSDKDWDLLLSDKVSRFNWMTKNSWKNVDKTGPRPKEITLENWSQHYLHAPSQHLSVKAIMGDEGDNLPGIEGIGPKRGMDLITKYGDIHKLVEKLPIPGKAQYIQKLNAGKEVIKRNIFLMDIKNSLDMTIPKEFAQEILTALS